MTTTAVPTAPRTRSWLLPSLALAAVVATLVFTREPLLTLAALFVLVVPFEKLFPRHRQRLRRPHLGTDITYAIVAGPLGVAGVVVGIALSLLTFAWLPGLLLRPLVTAIPPLPRGFLGIVLFDFFVYWGHRFAHEIPFMWRFHRIHHSTEHLDWVSGFRAHPLDGALVAPGFVVLLAAGFSPEVSGALAVAQIVTGLFLHANVRWRWRPLHRVLITPEFHHWHHSNERDAHCSNYSVFLPVWDILFGTYFLPRDRRPARYGVDGPVSTGIVGQLVDPFRGLSNPLPGLRHPIAGARHVRSMLGRGIGQMRGVVVSKARATA